METGVWLINFVKEILPSVLDYEVIIWNDNSAAINIVNTGKFSQKTRHMATKCNYVYQQVKSGIWISESLLREEKVQLPLECHVMMTLQLLIG